MAFSACSRVVAPLLVLIFVCGLLDPALGHGQHDHDAKFLMVLFDGFRWDYPDFEGLENFKRFQKMGVRAEYMEPDYPSMSYPGYYTILTGLHPENHGFIGNDIYDPERHKFFDTYLGHDSNDPFWWEQAEPLWTAAIRTGRKTHVYLWPGCHVPIHKMLPDFYQPYEFVDGTLRLQQNLKDVVDIFSKDLADVAFVYDELPDHVGHGYGPDSVQIRRGIADLDRVLGTFLDGLDKKNLTNKVNIIFVSDHGMTKSDPEKTTYIPIADVIDLNDVEMLIGGGCSMGIIPAPGKLDKVYDALEKIKCLYVWKKDDIPEKLHFKRNNRVPPIQITVKKECIIDRAPYTQKQYPYYAPTNRSSTAPAPKRHVGGRHGYLPSEVKDMRAIFMAAGPAFVKNRRVEAIHATDVYNLAVHLMNIVGHPNNGTWAHVSAMLKTVAPSSSTTTHLSFVASFVPVVLFLIANIYITEFAWT